MDQTGISTRPTPLAAQASRDPFVSAVTEGLGKVAKTLPSKYFYDATGAQLFDAICELEEYYPYHTEMRMLPRIAAELGAYFPHGCDIVEFGAGSLVKIRLLLEKMSGVHQFVPIDISGSHLLRASEQLQREFPSIRVTPAVGDMTQPMELPPVQSTHRLGFFPGSTIGNFTAAEARQFLSSMRCTLGADSYLLIGVDTVKDPAILHRAYNDQAGVTAAFNLNILERINRELDANFEVDQFHHYAFYNIASRRIEMHLVSECEQQAEVKGHQFNFASGESIHTENSHKYSPNDFLSLARQAGWQHCEMWLDEHQLFSVYLLKALPALTVTD